MANSEALGSQGAHNRQLTQYKRRPLCCRLWLFASPPTERSGVMSQEKYIGMDVHQATISVAVLDSLGQVDHGKYSGDESGHDPGVPPGATRKFIGDLRRRDLC